MILVVVRALWVHDIYFHFFQILLDDDPVDMPDPFPKYETQGSKKLFIFRIPRFNNTVLIDPTANMDGVAGEPIIGGGGDGNGGDGNGGGGNGGGDSGGSTTGPPNGSAPMLLLNVFALVFPLLAAITLTVFWVEKIKSIANCKSLILLYMSRFRGSPRGSLPRFSVNFFIIFKAEFSASKPEASI